MNNQNEFFKQLKRGGVIIAAPNAKAEVVRQIDELTEWKQKIYVADVTGWHGQCFVKPDHSVVGKPPKRFVPELASHSVYLSQSGTFEGWSKSIRTFAEGQPTLITCLCLAYLGPLLSFLESGNVGLDLTGTSSIGKSKAVDLAASVWGAPLGMKGSIAASLRTTDNGAEQLMMNRANALLPLDEVNLLGIESRKQADGLGNLTFILGEGAEKNRHHSLAGTRASLVYMVTSNQSLADLLRAHAPSNAGAATVRLITVNADACNGYGVFDRLPDGYDSSGAAVLAMKAALVANHGHSIDVFLQALVAAIEENEAELLKRLRRYQRAFMERSGVSEDDGMAHRRALAFASIYAAGRLAKEFGALPIENIGDSVMTCFARSLAAISGRAAIEKVHAYVLEHKPSLLDLDDNPRPTLSKRELNKHPGFLKRRSGRHYLMMRTERWEAEFGTDARAMLVELKAARLLRMTEGFQHQAKVRKNRDKDRVYAIMID